MSQELVTPEINLVDLIREECVDNDNIRLKNIVTNMLIDNQVLLKVLNEPELETYTDEDGNIDGENYLFKNIKPFYALPDTITNIKNYICYETGFKEIPRFNNTDKYGQLIFYILCDVEDIEFYGACRHDVLAYIITDMFNWSHCFDTQLQLISDESNIVDGGYVSRVLVFQYTKPNSILQTRRTQNPNDGNKLETKVINKTKGLSEKR